MLGLTILYELIKYKGILFKYYNIAEGPLWFRLLFYLEKLKYK